jgi:hypothetical protein
MHACTFMHACMRLLVHVYVFTCACVCTCRDRTMSVQEIPPSPPLEEAVRGTEGERAKGFNVRTGNRPPN